MKVLQRVYSWVQFLIFKFNIVCASSTIIFCIFLSSISQLSIKNSYSTTMANELVKNALKFEKWNLKAFFFLTIWQEFVLWPGKLWCYLGLSGFFLFVVLGPISEFCLRWQPLHTINLIHVAHVVLSEAARETTHTRWGLSEYCSVLDEVVGIMIRMADNWWDLELLCVTYIIVLWRGVSTQIELACQFLYLSWGSGGINMLPVD